RMGGQLIWATRFEEVRSVSKKGGKGGPSVSSESFSYYGNFAIGICEGEISHIGRIWADGKEIDQTKFQIRKHTGTQDQLPDPLIEAKQGFGRTPAFRGTAYVVFERFPLGDFGNRIPHVSFEIIRSVAAIDKQIRSITVIPGATEFGYSSEIHSLRDTTENRHNLIAKSDWAASIDELQALCPNLENVSLIVAWFGTDLRADNCSVEPRVAHKDNARKSWKVSGLNRKDANIVTSANGLPAYGGSPSDNSVIDAIADLKARGLRVTLYPFLMMDIKAGNALPDPYGGTQQSPYPWRGRVTCHPAIGKASSVDQTSLAHDQIEAFLGQAALDDYSISGKKIDYSGPEEWSYRRMILHYAHLCEAAGGVDAFLIGSEMRGLTSVRDDQDAFPFVDGLVQLATDCRSVLLPETKISYAADWSEYFGYHPGNVDNDVYFNLDPLWASSAIDAVAIDNYMPLANWSFSLDPSQPEFSSIFDTNYLKSNISGGEGFDWYYNDEMARLNQVQTPITDGSGEKWVWAYKDLKNWWANPHHERQGGVRSSTPTDWVPQSKPIWFTELGCPAIDRGANQPNLFIDAKSSEAGTPWFSKGGRDDLIALRYNQAHLEYWSESNSDKDNVNPMSSIYLQRMVSPDNIFLWTWDARPYPIFPHNLDGWSDGENWYRGHWLNGRLGTCPVNDLIGALFVDFEFEEPICKVDGHIDGFVVTGENSIRSALEPVLILHNISVSEESGSLVFSGKDYCPVVRISPDEMIQEGDVSKLSITRQSEIELPREIILSHADVDAGFDTVTSTSKRLETISDRQVKLEVSSVINRACAMKLANARLRDFWLARDAAKFQLPWKYIALGLGDIVEIDRREKFQVNNIIDGMGREIGAIGFGYFDEASPWVKPELKATNPVIGNAAPEVLIMNLPLDQSTVDAVPKLYFAASAVRWQKEYAIYNSPIETGYQRVGSIIDPATIFALSKDLQPGPYGRWDNSAKLELIVTDPSSEFESLDDNLVFSGSNALAVQSDNENWEIIQFKSADLIAPKAWRLSGLLRGQLGTEAEALIGASMGASGVLLDAAITPVTQNLSQVGLLTNWKIGPVGSNLSDSAFVTQTAVCEGINTRPLSPCHLRHSRNSGLSQFSWIRRSRIDSDNWEVSEVPLEFTLERYRIRVLNSDGQEIRTTITTSPEFNYSDTDRSEDLGALDSAYFLAVSQLSNSSRSGPETILNVIQ
ncbi:MAG: glycoside hydrolase/phage tail family protein, partial [Salaquimonas sp.]